MTDRHCKECEVVEGKKPRPAPHPGPRCATHHREVQRARGKAAHAKRIEYLYGITAAEYDALYEYQGGRCFICQRAKGLRRRLSVDHDHKTEEVRGLLCVSCNDLLGHARDDASFFVRAINYLNAPPFRMMKMWPDGRPSE